LPHALDSALRFRGQLDAAVIEDRLAGLCQPQRPRAVAELGMDLDEDAVRRLAIFVELRCALGQRNGGLGLVGPGAMVRQPRAALRGIAAQGLRLATKPLLVVAVVE
jgi:hypothetical protein